MALFACEFTILQNPSFISTISYYSLKYHKNVYLSVKSGKKNLFSSTQGFCTVGGAFDSLVSGYFC